MDFSLVQMDNLRITILYHLHKFRPYTLRDISCKSDMGGKVNVNTFDSCCVYCIYDGSQVSYHRSR